MCISVLSAGRVILVGLALCAGVSTANAQADWSAVDKAIGRSGTPQPGDVQKYSFPRADMLVTVRGIRVKPALALGSWVAFKQMGGPSHEAMAMGDLVLLENEVAQVITKLQAMGVEQAALHNHLQHESPRVMYLHITAQGDPVKIATAVRAALTLTKTPPALATGRVTPQTFSLDTMQLRSALGHPGKINGGVYQVSVPRADTIRMSGMDLPPAMGLATALNFQPTSRGKAAITGDFVLTAAEVNPVIRTLRNGGITVTALHSHMLGEEPRLFFMHFWANDDAVKLAKVLRAALGRMNVQP